MMQEKLQQEWESEKETWTLLEEIHTLKMFWGSIKNDCKRNKPAWHIYIYLLYIILFFEYIYIYLKSLYSYKYFISEGKFLSNK